jgi:hypothetical protein
MKPGDLFEITRNGDEHTELVRLDRLVPIQNDTILRFEILASDIYRHGMFYGGAGYYYQLQLKQSNLRPSSCKKSTVKDLPLYLNRTYKSPQFYKLLYGKEPT